MNKDFVGTLPNCSNRVQEYFYPNYFSFRISKLTKIIISKLQKGKVLDIGMGSGWLMRELFHAGFQPIGVDISERSIKEARFIFKKEKLPLRVRKSGALKLPFRNNFFNNVIFFNVFEHIKNQKKALVEAHRVVKKNGILVIAIPNPKTYGFIYDFLLPKISKKLELFHSRNLSKDFKKFNLPLEHKQGSPDLHVAKYNISSIRKLINESGFQAILVQNTGFLSHFFTSFFCSFLGISRKKIRIIEKLDLLLAKIVPAPLAIGWLFVAKKTK